MPELWPVRSVMSLPKKTARLALPILLCLLAIVFLLGSAFGARAAEVVGFISNVSNEAEVISGNGVTPVALNGLVHMQDKLRTGAKGHLQVTFRDNTTLTLGENATVIIDRYVYNPGSSTGEVALNASVAAFRLATGKLREMRNKKITVATPVAALAIRGTDVWWGPIEGHFGVLLVKKHNSNVEVSAQHGASTLVRSGEGTDIISGVPGRPYLWPPDKVASALQETALGTAFGPSPLLLTPLVVPLVPGIIESLQSQPQTVPASP